MDSINVSCSQLPWKGEMRPLSISMQGCTDVFSVIKINWHKNTRKYTISKSLMCKDGTFLLIC